MNHLLRIWESSLILGLRIPAASNPLRIREIIAWGVMEEPLS
jgi:hypothetical protein